MAASPEKQPAGGALRARAAPLKDPAAKAGDLLFEDDSQSMAGSVAVTPDAAPKSVGLLAPDLSQVPEARRSLVQRQHELLKILDSAAGSDDDGQRVKTDGARAHGLAQSLPGQAIRVIEKQAQMLEQEGEAKAR